MTKDEISYKDLSKRQLDNLKEIYVESRVSLMNEDQLREFVRTIIADQINDTVGNQEEREAWKEMKNYFDDDFEKILRKVVKENNSLDKELTPEKDDLEKRLELLEKRKKEKDHLVEDMW